jgi:RND family efflux transporter MFP subunit
MQGWRARLVFVVTCVLFAGAGGFVAGRSRQEAPAPVPASAVAATGARAAAPASAGEEFVAVVVARQDTLLTAKHEGRLLRVAVASGQRVVAGQVLAEMDRRTLAAELAAKQAEVAAAEAQLAGARSGLAAAGKAAQRARRLRDVMSATERERWQYERAAAGASVREKSAAVQELRADLERMQVGAEEAELAAPHDGVVANVYVHPDQWLASGAEVARIVGDERAVRFAVPVELRAAIAPGDAAQFIADDGRTRLDLEVLEVARDVDAASRLVFVEARLVDAAAASAADLLPGAQGVVIRRAAQADEAGRRASPAAADRL